MRVGIYDESYRAAAEEAYPDAEIVEIMAGGEVAGVDVAYLPASKAALRSAYAQAGARIITQAAPDPAPVEVFADPYESEVQRLVAKTESALRDALSRVDDATLIRLARQAEAAGRGRKGCDDAYADKLDQMGEDQ